MVPVLLSTSSHARDHREQVLHRASAGQQVVREPLEQGISQHEIVHRPGIGGAEGFDALDHITNDEVYFVAERAFIWCRVVASRRGGLAIPLTLAIGLRWTV